MPLALNWADVQTNGMPGFLRALVDLQKFVNRLEAQVVQQSALIPDPGWVGHYGAKLESQATEIGVLQGRVEDLELIVSEELLATLAAPDQLHAVVEELRGSWQGQEVRLPVTVEITLDDVVAGASEAVEQ